MASPGRSPSRGSSEAEPPSSFANVPATPPLVDFSFTLQTMMDVQKSVATLTERTDRLIKDVGDQTVRIEKLHTSSTFVKGAAWVIGVLVTCLWATFLLYLGKTLGK